MPAGFSSSCTSEYGRHRGRPYFFVFRYQSSRRQLTDDRLTIQNPLFCPLFSVICPLKSGTWHLQLITYNQSFKNPDRLTPISWQHLRSHLAQKSHTDGGHDTFNNHDRYVCRHNNARPSNRPARSTDKNPQAKAAAVAVRGLLWISRPKIR